LHAPEFYQPSGIDRGKSKGWLEVEKEGNTNYYRPAVDEGHALEESSEPEIAASETQRTAVL
jgi:hypothetical protein